MEIEKDKEGFEIRDTYVLNGRLAQMLCNLKGDEIKNVLTYLLLDRDVELSALEYTAVNFIDYANYSYDVNFY